MEKSFGRKPSIISRRAFLAGAVGTATLVAAGDNSTLDVLSRVTTEITRGVGTTQAAAADLPATMKAVTAKTARLARRAAEHVITPEDALYFKRYLAADPDTGNVRKFKPSDTSDTFVLLSEKPAIFKPVFNDINEDGLIIRTENPSVSSPKLPGKLNSLCVDVYVTPVLGSTHTTDKFRIKSGDETVDQKFGIWAEFTDIYGNPVNPTTGKAELRSDGAVQRYYLAINQLEGFKPLKDYTLATESPEKRK